MKSIPDNKATAALEFGLVVRYVNAALAFYRDLLGFEPAGEVIVPTVHMYRLRYGNSIMKLCQETAVPSTSNPRGPALGRRFLGLRVNNLQEIVTACEAAGVDFCPGPDGMPATSHIMSYNGVSVAAVLDPEGNDIELIQGNIWSESEFHSNYHPTVGYLST